MPAVKVLGVSWAAFSQYLQDAYFALPFATETKWGAVLRLYKKN